MRESVLIDTLYALIGKSITEVYYVKTKFYHDYLSGDWSNVNPDLFVLHSPEWEFKLSDGSSWYLTNPQEDTVNAPMKSNLTINQTTIRTSADEVLPVPDKFYWQKVIGQPIRSFRFWKQVVSSTKLFGIEVNKKYQEEVQIVELALPELVIGLTTMDGDMGQMTFYPRGFLGERIGIYFNKSIADLSVVHGVALRMEITYRSR
jgi:hypothetical protein